MKRLLQPLISNLSGWVSLHDQGWVNFDDEAWVSFHDKRWVSFMIFSTKGAGPMFTYLMTLIKDAPIEKLKAKYPEPFQSFGNKYLPIASLNRLIDLLTWTEDGSFNQNYFNSIRDIIEEILKRANAIDPNGFLPAALLRPAQNGRPNLKACELYLSGKAVDLSRVGTGGTGTIAAANPIFSPHIGWLFSTISMNSQILSHNYSYQVTPYAFRSTVLALVEILIWFKSYVDNNYPNAV